MPKTAAKNEQIRAQRRQRILQAAIPIFARHGYSEATMSDIAAAAGGSHGTVFLYYPTKEALFRAAVLEPLADLEAVFSLAGRAEATPLGRLRGMVHEQVEAVSRQGSYLRLTQYILGQRDRFPELAAPLFALADYFTAQLVPLIRAGQAAGQLAAGDPQATAAAYLSYLTGLGLLILGEPPGSPLWRHLAEAGVRLFGPLEERAV